MVVLVPDITSTGTATLNVSSLGAKTLKGSDGATNIPAGGLVAGLRYFFYYDGTNFDMATAGGLYGVGPFLMSGATTTAPSTPASGSVACYFDSTLNTLVCLDSSGNSWRL